MNNINFPAREENTERHTVHLTARRDLEINGVTDVISFDENCVSLETVCGLLDIEGEALGVRALSLESGRVEIGGTVSGMWYSEKKPKTAKKGFFSLGRG